MCLTIEKEDEKYLEDILKALNHCGCYAKNS